MRTSLNIGINTVKVSVRVVAKHVLVEPDEVRRSVQKVVRGTEGAPNERVVGVGKVRAIMKRHQAKLTRTRYEKLAKMLHDYAPGHRTNQGTERPRC